MPIDKRVTLADALDGVSDGATVFISGLRRRGLSQHADPRAARRGPKDLTLVVNSATHRYSLTHELIEAGLVRKVVCSAARGHDKEPSPFETLWMDGKIELEWCRRAPSRSASAPAAPAFRPSTRRSASAPS